MKKYVKKPIVIEAIFWNGTWETSFDVIDFCEGKCFRRNDIDNKREYLYIKTLEGEHIVSPRDYIIKGIKGEFYPCKPDIFKATYEEVIE